MKAIADIIRVHAGHPDAGSIARAADLIRHGKVVVFPTSGLYGLGADALNHQAVERVFAIKRRPPDQPVLVLIDRLEMMERVALTVTPMARYLMAELWPGKITFVVAAREGLPFGLTGGSGKIGVRLTAHPVARALVVAVDRPLTGTSANPSGDMGCAGADDLAPVIRSSVDLILDAGGLAGGPGSTVVDVTGDAPRFLRPGAVPVEVIRDVFQRYVLTT